jgi:hypothetical protein
VRDLSIASPFLQGTSATLIHSLRIFLQDALKESTVTGDLNSAKCVRMVSFVLVVAKSVLTRDAPKAAIASKVSKLNANLELSDSLTERAMKMKVVEIAQLATTA